MISGENLVIDGGIRSSKNHDPFVLSAVLPRVNLCHSIKGRGKYRGPQRRPGVANIPNPASLTRYSLLTFLLHTPQAARVLVLKDALDGNGGIRRVWLGGTSEEHQTSYACESSGPKAHYLPYSIDLAAESKTLHASGR